ncbi:hypothetical protein ACR77J_12270 [Tissierella praeacuta]|uniref:hypothetical protein n=1 Tax=Tissierella praeacuta TaxID=43131 RepID=UPI0010460933|nr:hypothetical protein [Tissierella praeacuta]TCU72901.1 hypothetical protein EV204_105237 [Tissierella praeacuta]
MKLKFCDYCRYLTLTENQQQILKLNSTPHRCILLDKQILHKGQHPRLPRLEDCPLEKEED